MEILFVSKSVRKNLFVKICVCNKRKMKKRKKKIQYHNTFIHPK